MNNSIIINPNQYIFLEENDHHPDILVGSKRLSLTPKVEQAAKRIGLQLQNNRQGYIGDISHQQSIDLLTSINSCNNSIYMAEFLSTLIQGVKGKPVYDGNKNQIDKKLLENILSDITEQRGPYRGEWYNTSFTKVNNILQINYKKFDQKGNIVSVSEPLDPNTLLEDKLPGIDLDELLNSPTSQGLPTSSISKGSLYYYHPRNGSVAGLDANSDWIVFSCDRYAQNSNSGLGVRPCFSAEGAKFFSETSVLDSTIQDALNNVRPFEYNDVVYVPVKGIAIK